MASQKPKITRKQMNQLMEQLEEAWWDKVPFVCADGSCSDRIHTDQANLIHGFFTIVEDSGK